MFGSSSDSLSITPELLGLSDVKVMEINTNQSTTKIIITVKSTRPHTLCRQCGEPTKSHGLGRTLYLKHLPMFGRQALLQIRATQYNVPDFTRCLL